MSMSGAEISDPVDLRSLYSRGEKDPLTRGDLVNGEPVLGFAFDRETRPYGPENDRILFAGDELRDRPPVRRLPTCEDEENGTRIDRLGPHPAAALKQECLVRPEDVAPHLPSAIATAISSITPHGEFIGSLIEEVGARDHTIWLIGGAVRDLLADATANANDLDFCGTILLGLLYETADELLQRAGLGDHRMTVSLGGVFAVERELDEGGRERIIEYKALALEGFPFLASGGDLAGDAGTRDFTVNALYYDLRRRVIVDPSGRGIQHVLAVPRTLAPLYRGCDPARQAQVVIRALKFMIRWPNADTSELADWVATLPGDLVECLSEEAWYGLITKWRYCIAEEHWARSVELAEGLGPVAALLVRTLLEREPDGR